MRIFRTYHPLNNYNQEIKKAGTTNKIGWILPFILLIIIFYLFINLRKQSKQINKLKEENSLLKKGFKINNSNKYSTLKNYYHRRIDNIFEKYRNKTEAEENEEYKNKFKQHLLNSPTSLFNKKTSNIENLVFDKKMNLGNGLFSINNYLYYCELFNCKNFYISKQYYPFIQKPLYNSEFGIKVIPFDDENRNICGKDSSLCLTNEFTFDRIVDIFRSDFFIPIRNYIFKDEFLSNMKLLETKDEDLYINIRSGEDVFDKKIYSPGSYFQPPLCFYRTIIENFNFSNIYIIANGKENPVINELLNLYNNSQYFHGTIEEDAAMIISAKNLVVSTSSFPIELLKFSDNLKNLFLYDMMDNNDKNFWHFTDKHLRPCKFNRFIMYPTKKYVDIMIPWGKKKEQFEIMINEKCNKMFKIIPSDFI